MKHPPTDYKYWTWGRVQGNIKQILRANGDYMTVMELKKHSCIGDTKWFSKSIVTLVNSGIIITKDNVGPRCGRGYKFNPELILPKPVRIKLWTRKFRP